MGGHAMQKVEEEMKRAIVKEVIAPVAGNLYCRQVLHRLILCRTNEIKRETSAGQFQ